MSTPAVDLLAKLREPCGAENALRAEVGRLREQNADQAECLADALADTKSAASACAEATAEIERLRVAFKTRPCVECAFVPLRPPELGSGAARREGGGP